MKPIQTIVETAVYVDDLDAAERFYHGILGLPVFAREEGRHVFFRVGDQSVLLPFLPDAALKSGQVAPHGAKGPGHFAMGIAPEDLTAWNEHLQGHAIAIEEEVQWPRGGRSIYFRDPAGNSVELLTPGLWGLPSGW
jgi:catechol 2,3-dioxygenase-like lactoylglutathione lyase family enzyme